MFATSWDSNVQSRTLALFHGIFEYETATRRFGIPQACNLKLPFARKLASSIKGSRVLHGRLMAASNAVQVFQTSGAGRLNTTKCDSEKLTMKLAPVASIFPSRTGMKRDAITTVAVFAAKPAT